MNLDELRDELTTRAAETDARAANLLPGVRRKITHTKRRRVATTAGVIAAVAAIAIGLLPGLTNTSTPDPSEKPSDYTRHGMTFHGLQGDDILDKAWIGRPGEQSFDFNWTPTTNSITFLAVCRSKADTARSIRVRLNGRHVFDGDCESRVSQAETINPFTLGPDDGRWVDTPIGQPARVSVTVIDPASKRVGAPSAQLALGIYRSPVRSIGAGEAGGPVQVPPAGPDDYSKAGIRFRAKVGGDTLAAAEVGDRGQGSLKLRFTSTGAPLSLRAFCNANATRYDDPPHSVTLQVNGGVPEPVSCVATSTDVGAEQSDHLIDNPVPAGRPIEVIATVIDRDLRPVSVEGARLALGAYFKGERRQIGGPATVDEVVEEQGYRYKLDRVVTADAATARQVSVQIPAGKPVVIAAGSSPMMSKDTVYGTLAGASVGYGYESVPRNGQARFEVTQQTASAGSERTVTLKITEGKPTTGKLFLALYLPAE